MEQQSCRAQGSRRKEVCRTLEIVSSLKIDAGCLDESGPAVGSLWVPTLGLMTSDDISYDTSYNTSGVVAVKRQYEFSPGDLISVVRRFFYSSLPVLL